jgi:hypothetical protein
MRILAPLILAASLTIAVPLAYADNLVISPEVGVKFHDDVTMKKYKSYKWDGDLKIEVFECLLSTVPRSSLRIKSGHLVTRGPEQLKHSPLR